MEESFRLIAGYAALSLEGVVVLLVCVGAVETLISILRGLRLINQAERRRVWMRFARWLLIALEFALGADIVRTAIAPTWNDIGQLAAIAGVRTVLGYFLERDIDSFGEPQESNTPQ